MTIDLTSATNQTVAIRRLSAKVEHLRRVGARAVERAEGAERTCAELQATLEYTVSLLLCDEAARHEALDALLGGLDFGADPDASTRDDGPPGVEWRPCVIPGGRA